MKWKVSLAALSLWTMASIAGASPTQLPPVEVFFRDPAFRQVTLSPDGRYLAALTEVNGTNCLLSVEAATRQQRVILRGEVLEYDWVSDDRLLVMGGGLRTMGGMFAVNRDGSEFKVLVPPIIRQLSETGPRLRVEEFLDTVEDDPRSVLVTSERMNLLYGAQMVTPDVRRLNVYTGESKVEVKNPGDVVRWCLDHRGQVRAALAIKGEDGLVLHRELGTAPWKPLLRTKLTNEFPVPIGFTADNRKLFIALQNGQDTIGLWVFDPAQGVMEDCIWRQDRADLQGLFMSAYPPRVPLGILYETDRTRVHWLDATMRAHQARVDAALPDSANLPVSMTRDGARLLYYVASDRSPGAYYILNPERGELELYVKVAPWIDPELMAAKRPIRYPARDGLVIPGYLTTPRLGATTNLPLVLLPHGGPWTRTHWEFDPEVQFLASRGYAVLQPNFRGSTGYGAEHERAGFQQFGLKMQDDLTDAVHWAVKEGIADPARVAIFGASYGGYAAMLGLTQTPELYRCGINCAGVTDLARQLRWQEERGVRLSRSLVRLMVGDYRRQRRALKAASPINHIENLRAPVLLIYGGRDPIVDIEHGRRLERELKRHGKPYEFVYEPQEGHGFREETNRFKLYRRIETFLGTHLGGGSAIGDGE